MNDTERRIVAMPKEVHAFFDALADGAVVGDVGNADRGPWHVNFVKVERVADIDCWSVMLSVMKPTALGLAPPAQPVSAEDAALAVGKPPAPTEENGKFDMPAVGADPCEQSFDQDGG